MSQQPDIVSIICHRCYWHWWQICRRCRWYRRQYLDVRICPRIFEKIRNGPNGIFWGWGGNRIMKKTEAKKSRDTVPLKQAKIFEFSFSNWRPGPLRYTRPMPNLTPEIRWDAQNVLHWSYTVGSSSQKPLKIFCLSRGFHFDVKVHCVEWLT